MAERQHLPSISHHDKLCHVIVTNLLLSRRFAPPRLEPFDREYCRRNSASSHDLQNSSFAFTDLGVRNRRS